MSGVRRTALQVTVLAVILLLPYLIVLALPMVGAVLPGWLVRLVCIGFLCSVTFLLLFVPFLVLFGAGIATLSDRGYLPGAD